MLTALETGVKGGRWFSSTLAELLLCRPWAVLVRGSLCGGLSVRSAVRLPTGEPCAGEPHARFGGRGPWVLNQGFLPLSPPCCFAAQRGTASKRKTRTCSRLAGLRSLRTRPVGRDGSSLAAQQRRRWACPSGAMTERLEGRVADPIGPSLAARPAETVFHGSQVGGYSEDSHFTENPYSWAFEIVKRMRNSLPATFRMTSGLNTGISMPSFCRIQISRSARLPSSSSRATRIRP